MRSKKLPMSPYIPQKKSLLFLIGGILGFMTYPLINPLWEAPSSPEIRVCFSPNGQCTRTIVQAIEEARASILVMAYSFTSEAIAKALVQAHQRGVSVKVLLDRSQIRGLRSQGKMLLQSGIPIWIDLTQGIAHNKVMILDSRFVLTGSFNFTQNAETRNAENLLRIDNPSLAKIYTENWEKRCASARKLTIAIM